MRPISRYAKIHKMQYLLVSPSPRLYLDKRNVLKYSTMKLKHTKAEKGNKQYLDRYAIMDAVTGCLYLEYLPYGCREYLYAFLHRAWSEKSEEFPFCGMPESLVVMPSLADTTLLDLLESNQIRALKPESGFASGIRVFRSISEFEDIYLIDGGMWITNSVNWPLDLRALNNYCVSWLVQFYNGMPKSGEKKSRFKLWKKDNTEIRAPGLFDSFISEIPLHIKTIIKEIEPRKYPNITPRKKKRKYTVKTIGNAFDEIFPEEHWLIDDDRETAKKKWCEENSENLEQVENMIAKGRANDIFDMGLEYYDIGDYRSAMREYRRALEICPSLTDIHVHIGILFFKRHWLKLAKDCFAKGIELWKQESGVPADGDGWVFETNRPYMRALHNLGLTYEKMKKWENALECYLELLRLNPLDHQGIRYLIGHVYHQLGDFDNAVKRYQEASDWPDGAWNLVYLFFQEGMLDKAVKAVLQAIPVNKYVLTEILYPGHEFREITEFISLGGKDQAAAYRRQYWMIWSKDSKYIDFLRKINSTPEVRAMLEKERPGELSEFELKRITRKITEKI
ncbi:MAG TPA: tetratricopeptide repeat protein [bacterium]|nr:tetratricopeptide repeat protein [bacterium]